MCGIAGVFSSRNVPPDRGVLERMTAALAHRGPDAQVVELGPHWGLGSRRLAIIGVATGHQPMANEDGTVWVSFNGEIYNHRRLRADLETRGHRFQSTADTEVLVHLYEEHGAGMLAHLQGMFAFAVVDARRRTLFLARDRLGQKPVYYHWTADGALVFASELQSLRQYPAVPRDLNLQALHDYLSLLCVPAADTIYAGVLKLPPACFLEVGPAATARPEPVCYWRPAYAPKCGLTFAEAAERTRALLEAAVAKRLEAEVPLGAFLSGGLDSSAVVALMARHATAPVRTFTIGFMEPKYDERRFAEIAALHTGTAHHVKVAEPRDVGLLRRLLRHHGEPFCDASMLPTALLSAFTRERVTVALSGDGGDELFGGYQRYQVMALQRYLQAVPQPWRRRVCDVILKCLPAALESRSLLGATRRLLTVFREDGLRSYGTFQEVFSEPAKRTLYAAATPSLVDYLGRWERITTTGSATDFVERFLELDLLWYLPSDLLAKVDTASMMYSLEVRCPFMDHELVEFAASLPRSFKVTMLARKRVLRHAVRDLLPPALLGRGKRGFGVPVSAWLRDDLEPLVAEMVATAWPGREMFDGAVLSRLAAEHRSGVHDHGAQLWALLCFRLWAEECRG